MQAQMKCVYNLSQEAELRLVNPRFITYWSIYLGWVGFKIYGSGCGLPGTPVISVFFWGSIKLCGKKFFFKRKMNKPVIQIDYKL